MECKSRKSRDTWSNRQIWPWSTEWNRATAYGVLTREHTSHGKHPLSAIQEKTLHIGMIIWSIPKSDWLILCGWRWRSSIQSAKKRLGVLCGSDHELLRLPTAVFWPGEFRITKIQTWLSNFHFLHFNNSYFKKCNITIYLLIEFSIHKLGFFFFLIRKRKCRIFLFKALTAMGHFSIWIHFYLIICLI